MDITITTIYDSEVAKRQADPSFDPGFAPVGDLKITPNGGLVSVELSADGKVRTVTVDRKELLRATQALWELPEDGGVPVRITVEHSFPAIPGP